MESKVKDLKPKSKKKRKDPRVEEEYFEEVELTDPATGKVIKQKVKITRYRATGMPKVEGNKGLPDEEVELEFDELSHSFNSQEGED